MPVKHLEFDPFNRFQEKELGRDTPLVAARALHVAGTECLDVTWIEAGLRIVVAA